MAKIIKCPNCGASDPEKVEGNQYQCNFCESHFVLEEKTRQTDVSDALNQMYQRKQQFPANPQALKKVRTSLTIGMSVMLLTVGLGVFIAFNASNDEPQISQPGMAAEDDYWSAGSINKFYVFEGSKGPVIWMLINQSSKGLDSAKYTLQLVDPAKGKVLYDRKYVSMSWNESFNFRNYLSEMISFNDKVYFLSEENGISVYDLYTGRLKMSNDEFAKRFTELASGVTSAKDKYYKNAVEIMTNDGFKFNFLPKYDLIVSEEEFNDYKKGKGVTGGFVFSEAPRQKLYYVISEQDTLRNDFSFSEHYLRQYLQKGKAGNQKEMATGVDTSAVFFNARFLMRNKQQAVFVYTEKVDKKSKAFLVSYNADDFSKPCWKIEMSKIKGFEKIMADDVYLRTHESKKELAIWYQTAEKNAAGIDLKTGKINWIYKF